MNLRCILHLRTCSSVFIISSIVCASPVTAAEWWNTDGQQSGFSEFAPPVGFSPYSDSNPYDENKENKQWRSGSSFNEDSKVVYVPVTTKNPWKANNTSKFKQSFSGRRPWGNVPERKPPNTSNMKFHDQRFKQWSHQLDLSYKNDLMMSDPLINYGNSSLPFTGGYGLPGSIYNSPLITPALYPIGLLHRTPYGMYPGGFNPYSRLLSMPWSW